MTNFAATAPNYSYTFVDTTNGAADITVDTSYLLFGSTNAPVCEYKYLIPKACTLTEYLAATLQVTTLTITAVASTTYSFYIQQYNPITKQVMTRFYTAESLASGSTNETIGDDFRDQINADQAAGQIQVVATGTTTLILTAQTGYPIFDVVLIDAAASIAEAATTPGVRGYGAVATLAAQGLTGYTGSTYSNWHIEFFTRGSEVNTMFQGQRNVRDYFLNTAATNYAALLAAIKDVMSNYPVGGTTVANPEALSLLDS